MEIIPRANQILIKLVEVEEVNEWGFVMGTKMEINREQEGQFIGTIEAFGPFAFTEWDNIGETLTERCNNMGYAVGDRVLFRRYDGYAPPLDEFKNHRIIESHCLLATLEE